MTPVQKKMVVAAVAILVFGVLGLTLILLPSYLEARNTAQRGRCINNLTQIDNAKEVVGYERKCPTGAIITAAEVTSHLRKGVPEPVCPKGGRYTINPYGTDPSCSVHGTRDEAMASR